MSKLAEKLILENLRTKNPTLDLGRCGLEGTEKALEQLQECTHLQTLIFSNKWSNEQGSGWISSQNQGSWNQLMQIPKNLPQSLKTLILSGNEGWGIQNITSLQHLKGLEKLSLSSNNLQDISFLKELKQLKFLDLESNQIQNLSPLADLEQLEYLDLCYNQISNIDGLRKMKNLQKLDLSENQIQTIEALQHCQSLTYLDASENQIQDISCLKGLKKLKKLELENNEIEDLSALQNLQNLQQLYAAHNQIQNVDALRNLTNLTCLILSNNQISAGHYAATWEHEELLWSLQNLQNLQQLDLSFNEGIIHISQLKNLRNLQYLDLTSTSLQIENIAVLQYLPNLKRLDLYDIPIQDITFLKNLKNLEGLSISHKYLGYPPICYVFLRNKGGKLGDYIHLPELPQVEKIWQLMKSNDEKNMELARQLAQSQGWTEEGFEMYQKLL